MKHKLFFGLALPIMIVFIISMVKLPSNQAKFDPGNTKSAKIQNVPAGAYNPKIIYRCSVGHKKLVALTIDDGPDAKFTPQVLNILNQYHIKATFFVVGESIKQNPDLLIREIKDGNEIENHTYTHPDLQEDGLLPTQNEILQNQQLIEQYTHKQPYYFRPPKGLLNTQTINISKADGYKVVLWSICVEHAACKTPEKMAARVIKAASPGTIILAHDGRLDRNSTMEALPLIIKGYEEKGYRFVTLDQMFNQEQHIRKRGMLAKGKKESIPSYNSHLAIA